MTVRLIIKFQEQFQKNVTSLETRWKALITVNKTLKPCLDNRRVPMMRTSMTKHSLSLMTITLPQLENLEIPHLKVNSTS